MQSDAKPTSRRAWLFRALLLVSLFLALTGGAFIYLSTRPPGQGWQFSLVKPGAVSTGVVGPAPVPAIAANLQEEGWKADCACGARIDQVMLWRWERHWLMLTLTMPPGADGLAGLRYTLKDANGETIRSGPLDTPPMKSNGTKQTVEIDMPDGTTVRTVEVHR
jgi:hypothetical protein